MRFIEFTRERKIQEDAKWKWKFVLFPVPIGEPDDQGRQEMCFLEWVQERYVPVPGSNYYKLEYRKNGD